MNTEMQASYMLVFYLAISYAALKFYHYTQYYEENSLYVLFNFTYKFTQMSNYIKHIV